MSRQSSGAPRYVSRGPARLANMLKGNADLGPALDPQTLLIWLRLILELDDRAIAELFRTALECDPAQSFPELMADEVEAALAAAAEVTTSRVVAWRKRNREMTWLEMRMLLLGLREAL